MSHPGALGPPRSRSERLYIEKRFRSIEVVIVGAPVIVFVQVPKIVPGPTKIGSAFAGANWPMVTLAPLVVWFDSM